MVINHNMMYLCFSCKLIKMMKTKINDQYYLCEAHVYQSNALPIPTIEKKKSQQKIHSLDLPVA